MVAVVTDVVRDGKPVAGFAFNSTGRYACGAQMRDRFIPRIRAAKPETLLDGGGNLDPEKILACMMQREKAGGHSERSIAIGTIEVAVWDAVAKIAGKPLHALLAERFDGGKVPSKVFCYVGGGWYWPGQTIRDLQDEMRCHLDSGYTMVKMKVGGLPLDEDLRRLEAVLEVVGSGEHLAVDANCKFDCDDALRYAEVFARGDGSFSLSNIAPGKYWLVARAAPDDEPKPSARGWNSKPLDAAPTRRRFTWRSLPRHWGKRIAHSPSWTVRSTRARGTSHGSRSIHPWIRSAAIHGSQTASAVSDSPCSRRNLRRSTSEAAVRTS